MSPLSKFRRQRGRWHRNPMRRGAVAAEAAIILPIFILAMVGMIEFGRAIMVQQILVNAAREGARRAVVPGATSNEVKDIVDDYLVSAGLGVDTRKVAVWDEGEEDIELADAVSHQRIQVVVQVPNAEIIPIGKYFQYGSMMKARVQMRKE